jgi:hypothetical protein
LKRGWFGRGALRVGFFIMGTGLVWGGWLADPWLAAILFGAFVAILGGWTGLDAVTVIDDDTRANILDNEAEALETLPRAMRDSWEPMAAAYLRRRAARTRGVITGELRPGVTVRAGAVLVDGAAPTSPFAVGDRVINDPDRDCGPGTVVKIMLGGPSILWDDWEAAGYVKGQLDDYSGEAAARLLRHAPKEEPEPEESDGEEQTQER